jgi:hypothetical protein
MSTFVPPGISGDDKSPLFRSGVRRTGTLAATAMHRVDAWRMIQRRPADLGMKFRIGCHTFRATGITAYLEAGCTLENAQTKAAHESPRTTKLAMRSHSTRSSESQSRAARHRRSLRSELGEATEHGALSCRPWASLLRGRVLSTYSASLAASTAQPSPGLCW